MKVSAELTLEIDRLRQNAQAAEAHLKRVGVVGAAMSAGLDRSMAGVGRGLGRNIDTNRFRGLQNAIATTNQHVAKFGAGLGAAMAQQDFIQGGPNQGFRVLAGAAAGAAVVLGGSFVVSSVKAAASLQDTELQIARFSGSLATAQSLMAQGVDLSVSTPFETDTIFELQSGLLGAGIAAQDLMEDIKRLAAVAQDDQALRELGDVYGKGFANQKFDTERINQFLDRRINLLPALQGVTGLGLDDLRKAIEQGKVGIEEIRAALDQMRGPGGQFFGMMEARSKTLPGLWSTLVSNLAEVRKEFGAASVGPLSDGIETALGLMPQLTARAGDFGQSMASAIDISVAGLQDLAETKLDWSKIGDDFVIEFQGVLNRINASWTQMITELSPTGSSNFFDLLPGNDKVAGMARSLLEGEINQQAGNLHYLRNIELPLARGFDLEPFIDWPGRTGQPFKPGGAVEFVQGQIAKEEAKLAELQERLKKLNPPGDLRALKEVAAVGNPSPVSSPSLAIRRLNVELGDFHSPGYDPEMLSEGLAKAMARADAAINRRASKPAPEMGQSEPVPGDPANEDQSGSRQSSGGGLGQSEASGRYFVPGVMAQAINRLTRRSTAELVYMQAEKQTALLEGIGRSLKNIDSKMDQPQTVAVPAPGTFAKP